MAHALKLYWGLWSACNTGDIEYLKRQYAEYGDEVLSLMKEWNLIYYSPINTACQKNYALIVRWWLANIKNHFWVNITDSCGKTLLFIACEHGHLALVSLLTGKHSTNINMSNYHPFTPLAMACKNGHKRVVKMLLSQPDLFHDSQLPSCYLSALYVASFEGLENMVELLLQNPKTDINRKNGPRGDTPLMAAVKNSHFLVIHCLLANSNLDLDVKNNEGMDVLDIAREIQKCLPVYAKKGAMVFILETHKQSSK